MDDMRVDDTGGEARAERQRRKLIRAVLDRDGKYLAMEDVEVSPEERERFYQLVINGVISREEFSQMVAGIKTPDPAVSFLEIAASNYKRRILAYFTGVGFDNFEKVTEAAVEDFLKKYPNPYIFSAPKMDFLTAILKSNSRDKYEAYASEMKEFCAAVYGAEQEYAEQAKALMHEAEEWQVEQDSKKLVQEFLSGAVISGDTWVQNGAQYQLTPELLLRGGLGPRYLMEISGVEIALSRVFRVDVHEAAIAYVKFNDAVYVRGYYRSSSQGMWRYLPDYIAGNGEILWYGVGYDEESLTLPMKLQKQLNSICAKGLYAAPGVNMGFFLGGTARRFTGSVEEYKAAVAQLTGGGADVAGVAGVAGGIFDAAYYCEVMSEPIVNFGRVSRHKRPPESIDIEGGLAPNFRNQLDHYEMRTEMYGEVVVRQFPSMDDKLRYLIIERGLNTEKKAWVGGIEMNSPITSTGCKREWVASGDISTPLYEYQTMADGYGEAIVGEIEYLPPVVPGGAPIPVTVDAESGKVPEGYLSMWDKYLKLMPVVQRFLYTWR